MNTPKIRFKGFTDDWEQRKFKELCDVVTVGIANSATHAYSDSGVVMFRNQNIKPNFLDDTDIIHINSEFEVKYKNKRLKKNDLLVARTGYPGTACVVPEKYENSQTFTTLIARPNENVDPYFLCQYLNSDIGIKYFESTQIGGGQKNSGAGILNEMPVTLPSTIEEEKKIGDYFRNLDHLITLHQRKCDETKQLKKFMLQKMFPKNGEKNPEIRFEGFTDAWEQRKLDTVAKFSKGSGYSKGDLIETGTPIILYGRLYTKYETSISDVDTYVEAKEGSVYSKGGEVIVPASGETAEDIARAATVDKSGILLGGDLNVVMPNEDINSAFLAISISNGNSQRELAKKAQGKSVVHIHNEEIRNLIVPFPIKAEQNRIVDYFSTLDHLITLHQRKCEKLKALKKFMLQNMFI